MSTLKQFLPKESLETSPTSFLFYFFNFYLFTSPFDNLLFILPQYCLTNKSSKQTRYRPLIIHSSIFYTARTKADDFLSLRGMRRDAEKLSLRDEREQRLLES